MPTLPQRLASLLSIALIAAVFALWLAALLAHSWVGVDFYPLYFAGERIRQGLSPYGAEATAALAARWAAPFTDAGVAYPLPLLLLIVPLTLLPLAAATVVWTISGGLGMLGATALHPSRRWLILLALLYLPLHRGVVMGQATLIWFGLACLMIYGTVERRAWLVGLACALLVLKPQNGLIFAIAGLVWGLREDRRALWWFLGASLALWGLAFALQPGWLSGWIAQIRLYRSVVSPPVILPLGLLAVAACARLPWWSWVAAAQVVAFPITDLYSALPLLLCWVAVGGPLALIGAGLSWAWPIVGLPNTIAVFWLLLLGPLIISAGWRSWQQGRRPKA